MNNGDGSLTFSGKRNDSAGDTIVIGNINLGILGTNDQVQGNFLDGPGEYILDIGVNDTRLALQAYRADDDKVVTLLGTTYSSNALRTKDFTYTGSTYAFFRIWIVKEADFTQPLTIWPMACKKSLYDIDPSFQPYSASNLELTQKIRTMELKSMTVTGTTTDAGNLQLISDDRSKTLNTANSIIVQCTTDYTTGGNKGTLIIPVKAIGGGIMYVHCMSATPDHTAIVSKEITVTVYYYEL